MPLIEHHRKLNAKLVDFAGWEMPMQYGGVIEEYQAVRPAVGLFDVSHMGRIMVEGRDGCAPNFRRGVSCNRCPSFVLLAIFY